MMCKVEDSHRDKMEQYTWYIYTNYSRECLFYTEFFVGLGACGEIEFLFSLWGCSTVLYAAKVMDRGSRLARKDIIVVVEVWHNEWGDQFHCSLKPVLNWVNVCSLNILRTLQRTMIHFLIELLVCRIWFGQSKLYFILNWLLMRCKLWPELAADSITENVG